MLNLYRLKHVARCEEHPKITGDILELLFQFFLHKSISDQL